ncbi:ArsA-related P-loop ATPase [Paraliomyxa miuraensis]|uniref:ArsA-related P-loop ATPase n=1 Tax=Paraliomyxa miuraensis TaxID=376150 RepID=UPI002259232B|nr:ArsA-related P-loop ATPase [Paraliomyxa miuraensis]MCX4243822.1 ATPase [Paraliomyxa miuraensis]
MSGPAPGPFEAPPGAVFDRLARRRLVVVSGKGGVGRTTLAALMGLAMAARGRRVLVATTGHDDRLGWMLGAPSLPDTVRAVTERLHIQRLVPRVCLREYGAMVVRSERVSAAVFDNRVVRRLLQAIPGLDDFAVFGKAWHEAVRGDAYDLVIFDGPATGHLLYILGVPQAILAAIPAGPLTREAQLIQDSLVDPEVTEAVLVGLPERWPLTELGELGATVRQQRGIAIETMVVNGMWPDGVPSLDPPAAALDPEGVVEPVLSLAGMIGTTGRRHHEIVHQWCDSDAARRCGVRSVLTVPWRWEGLCDLGGLERMLAELEGGAVIDHQPSR